MIHPTKPLALAVLLAVAAAASAQVLPHRRSSRPASHPTSEVVVRMPAAQRTGSALRRAPSRTIYVKPPVRKLPKATRPIAKPRRGHG